MITTCNINKHHYSLPHQLRLGNPGTARRGITGTALLPPAGRSPRTREAIRPRHHHRSGPQPRRHPQTGSSDAGTAFSKQWAKNIGRGVVWVSAQLGAPGLSGAGLSVCLGLLNLSLELSAPTPTAPAPLPIVKGLCGSSRSKSLLRSNRDRLPNSSTSASTPQDTTNIRGPQTLPLKCHYNGEDTYH